VIEALQKRRVTVKVIGANDLIICKVCREVGSNAEMIRLLH
jgi:hypothetical protein